MAFDFVGLTGTEFSVINKSIHKFNSGWKITGKDFVLMGSVLNFHLICHQISGYCQIFEAFTSPTKLYLFELSWIKLTTDSDLALFKSGNVEFKIGLSPSKFGYCVTKCSIILKSRTGAANSCFVTINGTTKLSFNLGIQEVVVM